MCGVQVALILLCKKTTHDNHGEFDQETVTTVLTNFYVDDCLKSVSSEEEGIRLSKQLCDLLQKRRILSPKMDKSIPEEERAKTIKNVSLDQIEDSLPVERALGVRWNIQSDCFEFKSAVKDKPLTKRGLLSVISSIYDPLGFVSAFILPAKRILQQFCRLKLGWDQQLPNTEMEQWLCWLDDLPKIEKFSIPRCIKGPMSGDTQMVFIFLMRHSQGMEL